MSCRYYDDALLAKLNRWIPEASNLRVLKPDETKRLFELTADDQNDNPFKLPLVALSRSLDLELLSTVKSPKSFDGISLLEPGIRQDLRGLRGEQLLQAQKLIPEKVAQFNVLPIKLTYQLDIYTKTAEECEEYVRTFLFKLINNPVIKIGIPYNDLHLAHVANIRVLPSISDTSAISERIFSGQFTRWTIQLEIQDAFLFSVPYRRNWRIFFEDGFYMQGANIFDEDGNLIDDELIRLKFKNVLEVSENLSTVGEIEQIDT